MLIPSLIGYSNVSFLADKIIELTNRLANYGELFILVIGEDYFHVEDEVVKKIEIIKEVYINRGSSAWLILFPQAAKLDFFKLFKKITDIDVVNPNHELLLSQYNNDFYKALANAVINRFSIPRNQQLNLILSLYNLDIKILEPVVSSEVEETQVMIWYIKIEDTIQVKSDESASTAYGLMEQLLVRDDKLIEFNHLVVIDEQKEVVGVVKKSILRDFLHKRPVNLKTGTLQPPKVSECMFSKQEILQFKYDKSKNEIHDEVRAVFNHFKLSEAIFLIDDDGKVIGFATLTDLW